MTVRIAETRTRSWLDPRSSRALAAEVGDRLRAKFSKRRGLFITLTYERSKYKSPLALYRAQSDERHVRRFIERLGAYLGRSLRGLWLRKLEFQEGGWTHFHICLDWPERIPHAVLMELWGHGNVWVNRMTRKRASYFAKYASKAEDIPAFLLLERTRSVKIIAVSPGFWGESDRKRYHQDKRPKSPCYVTMADRLAKPQPLVVREGQRGRVRTFNVELWRILRWLRAERVGIAQESGSRWLAIDAGFERLCAMCAHEEERAGRQAAKRPPAGPLYLTEWSNPPDYFTRYLEEEGVCSWEVVAA